jgi:hypothetical protein
VAGKVVAIAVAEVVGAAEVTVVPAPVAALAIVTVAMKGHLKSSREQPGQK